MNSAVTKLMKQVDAPSTATERKAEKLLVAIRKKEETRRGKLLRQAQRLCKHPVLEDMGFLDPHQNDWKEMHTCTTCRKIVRK